MSFRHAVVTGASSGIGEALAYLLADQGIPLTLVGRNVERLEAVASTARAKVPVTTLQLDLAHPDQRAQLVQMIQRDVPDLVINNAGAGLYGEILSYETSKLFEVFDINATATFELTVEAARSLVTAERKGVVMNISSASAFQPFPWFATYAASKAFVKNFGEAMDYEVAPHGVRVLTSCPGVVVTGFQQHAINDMDFKPHRLHTVKLDVAVQDIWSQILSCQTVRVFDWKYRLMAFLSEHILPRKLLFWILQRFFIGQLPQRSFVRAPQWASEGGSK